MLDTVVEAKNDLNTWLAHINSVDPNSVEFGLERVGKIANRLKLFPLPFFTITVAGTNGKGSCVRLLERILSVAGFQVGAYTSPHLIRYHERIRLLEQEVSDEMLCYAFEKIEEVRADVPLTFFEFTTLAALLSFKMNDVQIAILEVGLGGRLDAVNIVDPDIAVITSIDIDHIEHLGYDRRSIAQEKAGIMRPDTPMVCGDRDPPTNLEDIAYDLDADLYSLGLDFFYDENEKGWWWKNISEEPIQLPKPILSIRNASSVLKVLELLPKRFQVSRQSIEKGLTSASLPGRQQVIPGDVTTILDVAHNPESVELLAEFLSENPISGRTYAVFSICKDKDIVGTTEFLIPLISCWHIAPLATPRGLDCKSILKGLSFMKIKSTRQHASISEAYRAALAQAKPGDRVVVYGSFHTVAEVMILLNI